MITDKVDGIVRPVNDVDHAVGHASLLQHIHEHHARRWVALGRLHDVRVAANGPDREHPVENKVGVSLTNKSFTTHPCFDR